MRSCGVGGPWERWDAGGNCAINHYLCGRPATTSWNCHPSHSPGETAAKMRRTHGNNHTVTYPPPKATHSSPVAAEDVHHQGVKLEWTYALAYKPQNPHTETGTQTGEVDCLTAKGDRATATDAHHQRSRFRWIQIQMDSD
jgi:hypothetical protein